MFNPIQLVNKEPQPDDIPQGALEHFYGGPKAGEAEIAHVLYTMEASQRIPMPLSSQVERQQIALPPEQAPAAPDMTEQPVAEVTTEAPVDELELARQKRLAQARELTNAVNAERPQLDRWALTGTE